MATTELTPMQRQYQQMKAQNKDCILFFRLGDFYEMFNEDAKLAARELDLTLTSRGRSKPKEEQTPMCGVPYHSVDSYIARLVQKGYKVAICEQMEDPATAKGLVERDITRIITPGTVTESCMLEESKNNFMGCICAQGGRYGLAFCDLSTGAFFSTTCVDSRSVCSELGRFSPSEVLRFGEGAQEEEISDVLFRRLNCCVDEGTAEDFELTQCEELLHKHFGKSVQDLGMGSFPGAIRASGALLKTLLTLQKNDLAHIRELQYYTNGRFMELDLDARRNLELTETMRSKEKRGTLLWVLDKTHTAMGGRMLRSWLEKPLLDPAEITRRQQAVEALVEDPILRGELEEALKEVTDLERVMTRIVTATVNCRDLLSLARGLRALPQVKGQLEQAQSGMLQRLAQNIDTMESWADRIENTIVDEPPLTVREGGMIRRGADPDADRLRDIMDGGSGTIAAIEASEREKTGIRTLKVGFNRVFGYYIEVSKSFIGPGAPHLYPQADPGQLRALHHPGAERPGNPGPHRQRPADSPGIPDLPKAPGGSFRSGRRRAAVRRSRGCRGHPLLSGRRGRSARLLPPGDQPGAGNLHHRWPPSGGGGRCCGTALFVPNDTSLGGPGQPGCHHHRPQHGRQVHLYAPGGPHRPHGPDGLLRPRPGCPDRHRRPGIHPHRRQRRPGRRPVHLYGGDVRGGRHSEIRHLPQSADPGRDRQGHLHL